MIPIDTDQCGFTFSEADEKMVTSRLLPVPAVIDG